MSKPLINCYYYCPHHHALLDQHLEWDLAKMAELGTDIVSVCVEAHDMTLWFQQRLRNVVTAAHKHGLKIHAVPNRWGGITAGWSSGGAFVEWTEDETIGRQNVRSFFERQLKVMLSKYDFDGVIWDEPRPPEDAAEIAMFLDEMSEYAKNIKPDLVVSLFCASDWLDFAPHLVPTEHIDYLGSDGHVRSNDHQMHRMKPTIFQAHDAFYPVLHEAGKKTVFLLEGQRHRDEDLDNFLENLDRAFALPMEQLMYYFSAHEMSPEKAQIQTEAVWEKVRQLSGK